MNSFIQTFNQGGETFLNFAWPMFWQSSLLIAFVFALDFLLTRKIRASVRYALWLAVLVKLILPPTFASPTSATWWLWQTKTEIKTSTFKNYSVTYDNAPQTDFVPKTIPLPASLPPKLNVAGYLLLASIFISAILFSWLAIRWWQVARMVRRATDAEDVSGEMWSAWARPRFETGRHVCQSESGDMSPQSKSLAAVRQLAGLRSPLRLKLVEGRMSPAVCGLFRPVILLPRALAEKLSAEQLRAVLLHEIFHLRRKDVWVNCVQALLQIFYWWHPLLWVANARIRRVREEAVDDAVMLALRDEAETYAPTLLEVAKLALRRPLMSLGLVGIMESRSALRQRIERLMDFRAPKKAGLTFASLCGIFIFSAVALPMGEAPAVVSKNSAAEVLREPTNSVMLSGRGENRIVLPDISVREVALEKTNLPSVLIQAEIFQFSAEDFQKLTLDSFLNPQSKRTMSGCCWFSVSPEQFSKLRTHLRQSNFTPLMRPRIQTGSGMQADFFVGESERGTELDCLPVIDEQRINLSVSGKVDAPTKAANQFAAEVSLENHGGMVLQLENKNASSASNFVVFISAEIVTNSPQKSYQPDNEPLTRDGKLLYEMGKLDEAEVKLKAALALNPENADAKYYLGLAQSNRPANRILLASDGRAKIEHKLDTIRFDQVRFDAVPLDEVIRTLSEESLKRDADQRGINFLINPHPDQIVGMIDPATGLPMKTNAAPIEGFSALPITLALTNARLADVLDAVVLASPKPIKYSILDFAIEFSPRNLTPLYARMFKVYKVVFLAALQKQTKLTTNDVSILARSYFSKLGVDMESPAGKSVFYNSRLGQLYVRATEADLDVIQHAIPSLAVNVAPQIHIKARFVQVPVGTTANFWDLQNLTNSSTDKFTAILTEANVKVALRALESRQGVETLAEPEAISASGRQTQMRATDLITIVTNFVFQEKTVNTSNSIIPQMEKVEVGPILDVVPYVLSDGYTINLSVIPSLTEFLGYDKPPEEHISRNDANIHVPKVLPKFSIRQVVASANLWDGQTLVLGRMSTTNCITTTDGVPLLGDLPLMGRLFQSESKSVTTNELLVFITATIVDPAGNRVHTDEEMPFSKNGIPPQPPVK